MAVYKRSYHGYNGVLTPRWSRFLILSRYASRGLFRSRFMTGFFAACLFPFLVTALLIYLNHSASLLSDFKIPGGQIFDIDNRFFTNYLRVQVSCAFILAAFVGPGLISPDLANNALVLYLCRPFSRAEYVLGKFAVLAGLLSCITWIPALLLVAIQSSLAGWSWLWANLYIAGAIFAGSWVLIVVLSLVALALSAWVKWKPVAGALVLGVMFLGAGFAAAINGILRTTSGHLINIPGLLLAVWASLFRMDSPIEIPASSAWVSLLAISCACVYLLARKLRAYEVVR